MRKSALVEVRVTEKLALQIEAVRKQRKMRTKSSATRHILEIGLARSSTLADPTFLQFQIELERVAGALQRGLAQNAIPPETVGSARAIVAKVGEILGEHSS